MQGSAVLLVVIWLGLGLGCVRLRSLLLSEMDESQHSYKYNTFIEDTSAVLSIVTTTPRRHSPRPTWHAPYTTKRTSAEWRATSLASEHPSYTASFSPAVTVRAAASVRRHRFNNHL